MTPIEMLGVLTVLLVPAGVVVALLLAAEAWQRGRARVAARQIRLTDAVHAELGAVVAPVVEKRAFGPWRVIFAMPAARAGDVGRLMSITDRVLAAEPGASNDVQIVFTRPTPALRARAA